MALLSFRNLFLGLLSGLISGTICFILVYIVGVVAIALNLRDFLATVLASFTVLPLMLIFVLLIPTGIICVLIGFISGTILSLTSRGVSITASAIAGLVFGEIILGLALPFFATPSNAELLSIAGNRYLVGISLLICFIRIDLRLLLSLLL